MRDGMSIVHGAIGIFRAKRSTRFADFSAEVAAIAARVDALALRLDQAADTGSAKATKIKKTR